MKPKKPDPQFFAIARENNRAALIVFAREHNMIVFDDDDSTRIVGCGLVIDAGATPAFWLAPRGRAWTRILLDESGIEEQNDSGKWEVIPFADSV